MLIANPLFQIPPDCFVIGEAAKHHLADAKARYDNERSGYPASIHFHEANQRDQHRYHGDDTSRQLSLHRSHHFRNGQVGHSQNTIGSRAAEWNRSRQKENTFSGEGGA
jgi:hypothetical protein